MKNRQNYSNQWKKCWHRKRLWRWCIRHVKYTSVYTALLPGPWHHYALSIPFELRQVRTRFTLNYPGLRTTPLIQCSAQE